MYWIQTRRLLCSRLIVGIGNRYFQYKILQFRNCCGMRGRVGREERRWRFDGLWWIIEFLCRNIWVITWRTLHVMMTPEYAVSCVTVEGSVKCIWPLMCVSYNKRHSRAIKYLRASHIKGRILCEDWNMWKGMFSAVSGGSGGMEVERFENDIVAMSESSVRWRKRKGKGGLHRYSYYFQKI